MANALYRRLSDGSWINQASPGSAAMFRINHFNDGNFYPVASWDLANWAALPGNGFPTVAQAQTFLDNYMASVNGGTA